MTDALWARSCNNFLSGCIMVKKLACAISAVALSTTACLSINNKELPRIRPEKVADGHIILSVLPGEFEKTHNGRTTDLSAMGKGVISKHEPRSVARAWSTRKIVKEWGAPGELDAPATHKLTMNGTIDENSSIFASIMTGATLYLIPSTATMSHDLTATVERVADGAKFTATAKNSYTIWQWIGFAPLTPFLSVVWGGLGAENDRAFHLYQQLSEQGAFDEVSTAETQ